MRTLATIGLGLGSFLLWSGCTIGEVNPGIQQEDTTWIEKGKTTRAEIVAKFGEPDFTGTAENVGQYAEYRLAGEAPLSVEPRPVGPFPQSYQPPARSEPEVQSLKDMFWVVYSDQGVVQDYGVGPTPFRRTQSHP